MDFLWAGIGSQVAHWSQSVCSALDRNMRLQSYHPEWIWLDQVYCDKEQAKQSPWLCYFPHMEHRCQQQQEPDHHDAVVVGMVVDNKNESQSSPPLSSSQRIRVPEPCEHNQIPGFYQPFRAATVEYIFSSISPMVIQEAQRQVGVVFGRNGAPHDLITVHVRWGDKSHEMTLMSIDRYIDAVWTILDEKHNTTREERQNGTNVTVEANIYLATEDPAAVEAFVQAAPKSWNVFVDVGVEELTPFRPPSSVVNGPSRMAINTLGRGGLVNMASLLVSMEANDYVLSTASSFGRVMNNIRTNIIDPRCGNCTRLVDLQPGAWVMNVV
jgi:hypothetical protein